MGYKISLAAIAGILLAGLYTSPRLTLFERSCKQITAERGGLAPVLRTNDDGTIAYLFDDFSGYGNTQRLIDGFDTGEGILTPGRSGMALAFHANEVLRTRDLPANLLRWDNHGYLTMWLRTNVPDDIEQVEVELIDAVGRWRRYEPLINAPAGLTNTPLDDPELSDIPLVYHHSNHSS